MFDIDVCGTQADDERKNVIYDKIIALCLFLNIYTRSDFYATVRQ